MKKSNFLLKRTPARIFRLGIFFSMILILQSLTLTSAAQSYQVQLKRRSDSVYNYSDNIKRWLSWNILFNVSASDSYKVKRINKLKAYIDQKIAIYNILTGYYFKVDYHLVECPCDPRLTNLNATPAVGSTGSAVPPKPPPAGGSGDIVSFNFPMEPDSPLENEKYKAYNVEKEKVPLTIGSFDNSKILAIMDTGLDPDLLPDGFSTLIWKDPTIPTIRNFQFYHNLKPLDYMEDDALHVHGTAVTAIALQGFENEAGPTKPKPMIMVLKVLDEHGQGNIFSVSCGMSYAIQKKATLINASLGYYSRAKVDLILLHYVKLSSDVKPVPIPILAAAGNTQGKHDPARLCDPASPDSILTFRRTFHPASFCKTITNVISVTTIQNPTHACFYQNYSNDYVNVGVANGSGNQCCKFIVPFQRFGYEGSSFATPFISGKIMAGLMNGRTLASCRNEWNPPTVVTLPVTKGGRFVSNP